MADPMKPWEHYASQPAAKPWEQQWAAPKASRGERNNNPLNIEDRGQFKEQSGYLGSDGRFAKFDNPQDGIKAAHAQLARYMAGKTTGAPLRTVRDIVGTWSPDNDPTNPRGSTAAYVASVASSLRLGPDDPLDESDIPRLAIAMGQVETGNKAFGDKPWEHYGL